MNPALWPPLLVAIPLVIGLASCLLARKAQVWIAWCAPVVMLVVIAVQAVELGAHGAVVYEIGGWPAPLGITWRIDGLALLMLTLTALVAGAVCVYATGYFSGAGSTRMFWPLMFLMWTALNALFLSQDIFNWYVTLELLTLSSVGLIVLADTTDSLVAALRYLLLGLLGSMFYLVGIALIYGSYGVLDLSELAARIQPDLATWTALALMVAGLLIKAALFPMHFWLPPAHAGAPAPASALLSGLVIKGPFFILVKLWFLVFPTDTKWLAAQAFGLLGASAVLWGAIQAIRAERLKVLVAYSTVAQLGYFFLLFPLASVASVSRLAWSGSFLFVLSHGLAKSAMFLAVGSIQKTAGHDRIADLTGIGQQKPLVLSATALAGISLMGLPPSGGFAAKWMMLVAGFESGQWWWSLVLAAGGLLAAAYLFRFWRVALTAHDRPATSFFATWRLDLPAAALAVCALLLGFAATYLGEVLDPGTLPAVAEVPR